MADRWSAPSEVEGSSRRAKQREDRESFAHRRTVNSLPIDGRSKRKMKSLRMIISILGPVLGMLVITLAGVRPAYLQTGQTPPAQRPDPSIQGTAEPFKGITTDGKVREGLF